MEGSGRWLNCSRRSRLEDIGGRRQSRRGCRIVCLGLQQPKDYRHHPLWRGWDGGVEEPLGFGVSWQIVPTVLEVMLLDSDAARVERVMQMMLQMIEINLESLKKISA